MNGRSRSAYRYAYGSDIGISSVEMEPHNILTHQFPPSLEIIASELYV